MFTKIISIYVYACCLTVHAGRVLVVVPTPTISHQVVFRPLTQELAKRGHEVFVITPDPAFPKGKSPENLIEIDVHDISYKKCKDGLIVAATAHGNSKDLAHQMSIILPLMSEVFEVQVKTDEVQRLIGNRTNRFDLIVVESFVRPATALVHVLNAPLIWVSAVGGYVSHYDLVGAPARPPLLYPTVLRQKLFNLTLWEKVTELYNHYYLESIYEKQKSIDSKLVKKLFGADTPTMQELIDRVDMVFLNIHPIWEFNRPVPANVVYIGGIHHKPSTELPQDLKSYLDGSKHGVIYISYGTIVDPNQLPPEKIQIIVDTFSQLPYDVLWKWNNDKLPGRSNNIRMSKWLPQSDLLKHPKIKLFITQGGLQSTYESITAGVPLIGMPMLADQWYNVEQYVYRGIGLRVDMETLTEEELRTAIITVIEDKSYRANVVKLRAIMRDQPQRPLDRAVWWAEHVMRHGGAPHLRARVANMTWSEYLDLELLTFIIGSTLTALMITGYTASLMLSFLISISLRSRKLKRN